MTMPVPKMTYYTKVVDNLTGEQIFGYASTAKNKELYFGTIDGVNGGESQFSIFFDIWNNEPAWSGGCPIQSAQDATNCKLSITIPPNSRDINPFFYARCTTLDAKGPYTALSMSNKTFEAIKGNVSTNVGTILGTSDHATIQTKIILQPNCNINYRQYGFSLNFQYNYE